MNRAAFSQFLLWCFVISAGLVSGASIYERLVVWPLWAASPPESVTQWKQGGIQGAFFAPATLCYGVFSLAVVIASSGLSRRQRPWALGAGISGVVTFVWTLLFFVPILEKTQFTAGVGLSGEEITRLVNQFQTWQWGRWLLLIGGWIAGLRAFSLSAGTESP